MILAQLPFMNDLSKIPVQNDNLVAQNVDGELLILDNNCNKIHQLNASAAIIWEECDSTKTVLDIIEKLTSMYDVSNEQAENDVLQIVNQLQIDNLISLK